MSSISARLVDRSVKLVVLGDVSTSKRELLISLSNPEYPDVYTISHEFDPQVYHYKYATGGIVNAFEIHLYDSTGMEDVPDVIAILCRNASVVMFCYSVIDPASFKNLEDKWVPLHKEHFPDIPFIIVATNAQLRDNKETMQRLARKGIRMIQKSTGEYTSQKLGATAYIEAEITPRTNVEQAFRMAIEAGIKHKLGNPIEPPGLYVEFCRNGKDYELQELYDMNYVNIEKVQDSDRSPFLEAMLSDNIGFGCRLLELNGGAGSLANGELDFIPLAVLEWCRKGIVKELNLSNNNLMNIPLEICVLKSCNLEENPLLSLPREIRREKWPKVKRYLEQLKERAITSNHRKVALLGEAGAGKSTFAKLLGAKSSDPKADRTKLDILELKLKTQTKETITFKLWDFSASMIQQPTHRFFLTPGAIYLITFNFAEFSKANLEYWFKLVKQSAGNLCAIVLVGTHADMIPEDECERITREIVSQFPKIRFPAFDGTIIPVSSKTGLNQKKMKETLLSVAVNPTMRFSAGDKSWVQFNELILTNASSIQYIDYTTYLDWASTCSIEEKDLDSVTEFLTKVGTVIRYSNLFDPITNTEHDFFLINPNWIVNEMNALVAANQIIVGSGYASLSAFEQIFPIHSRSMIFALLSKYNVVHLVKEHKCILVPSLLPETKDIPAVNKYFPAKIPAKTKTIGRIFKFDSLPLDLLGRIMVCILRFPGVNDLLSWKNGTIISIHPISETGGALLENRIYGLFEFNNQFELSIFLRYEESFHDFAVYQWRKIMEGYRVMVASFYPRLQELTQEFIPCSHCMKPGTVPVNICKFPVGDCIEAMLNGETSVNCCGIRSASRVVPFYYLAPDIGLIDLPHIQNNDLIIRKQIGKGAFGIVYRAKLSGYSVALKELQLSTVDKFVNTQLFEDFQVETYIMSKLHHPNVVRIFGIRSKPLGIVLELITGTDLFQFMHTEDPTGNELFSIKQEEFPWKMRLQIACDIANGLHFLQSLTPPIIHRDLRSPNIFLKKDKTAVIGDFGLAREVYDRIGGILATWQWVAPECLDSRITSYDCRSDIYSLGIVFWELAAIEMPFAELADDPLYFHAGRQTFRCQEIKQAIIEEHLRPTIPTATPAAFTKLIQSCWQHDPSKRPSTLEIIETLSNLGAKGLDETKLILPKQIQGSVALPKPPSISKLPTPLAIHHMRQSAPATDAYVCSLYHSNIFWVGLNTGAIHAIEFDFDKNMWKLKKTWVAHTKRICSLLGVGETIWSYSEDGTIKVWETDTFALCKDWEISSHESGAMLLSSNSFVWVSSAYSGKILVFNPGTYALVHTIAGDMAVGAMHIEEHFNMIWTTSGAAGDKIAIYDLRTFESLGSIEAHSLRIAGIISLSPLPYLCSYSLSDIRLWGGTSVSTFHQVKTSDSQSEITTAIAVSGLKQRSKLFCSSFYGSVVQYDSETLKPEQELIAVDPDEVRGLFDLHKLKNNLFVTVTPRTIKVWPNIQNLNQKASLLFEPVSI